MTITKTNIAMRYTEKNMAAFGNNKVGTADNVTVTTGVRNSAQLQITTKLTDVSKYFVKDILDILESSDKKGKTKLKEIRSKMYGYLRTL